MAEFALKGEQRVFMTGNEVCAWACVAAKADIMYGYPITPQNEIMHYWTRLAPKRGKRFLQTEDEISAGFTTLGGVMSGRKAFTATAGPGNVLMQEAASMAEMMRLPVVMIIQQRGGPSTATVIYSQQELTLTTFGGNGEGHRIVYSTSNHQELFDYTIKSFNAAWTYRFPTFVLGDGYQAKMRESLTMYDPEERGIKLVPAVPMIGDTQNPDRPLEICVIPIIPKKSCLRSLWTIRKIGMRWPPRWWNGMSAAAPMPTPLSSVMAWWRVRQSALMKRCAPQAKKSATSVRSRCDHFPAIS